VPQDAHETLAWIAGSLFPLCPLLCHGMYCSVCLQAFYPPICKCIHFACYCICFILMLPINQVKTLVCSESRGKNLSQPSPSPKRTLLELRTFHLAKTSAGSLWSSPCDHSGTSYFHKVPPHVGALPPALWAEGHSVFVFWKPVAESAGRSTQPEQPDKVECCFMHKVTNAVAPLSRNLLVIIPTIRDFCSCDYSLVDT